MDTPSTCVDAVNGLLLTCFDITLFACFVGSGPEGEGATCSDGIDNDSDGFTDCAEPACDLDPSVCPDNCAEKLGSQEAYEQARQDCMNTIGLYWLDFPHCECENPSPVLVDITGDGLELTNRQHGVAFDINNDGIRDPLPWTTAHSDDAWLVLDRNGNRSIDNGAELFGNFTAQPESDGPNGFLALAVYDKPENGGNADGRIGPRDAIFASLRLWQDRNHNGISESNELRGLLALDVVAIDLDYRESRRVDQHGNEFKYRARVYDRRGASVGRWAWDVFLVGVP